VLIADGGASTQHNMARNPKIGMITSNGSRWQKAGAPSSTRPLFDPARSY